MNIKSKYLNKSEIARALGMTAPAFLNKINGYNRAKEFTAAEIKNIQTIIKKDLQL